MVVPTAPAAEPAVEAPPPPAPPSATVFLFDRRNRAYLERRTQQVYLYNGGLAPFMMSFFLVMALAMGYVAAQGGFALVRWGLVTFAGTTTRAEVIERRVEQGRKSSLIYYLSYAYTVNGQHYIGTQYVSAPIYRQANGTVEVSYWPPDPQLAHLSGGLEDNTIALASLAQFVFPGLFVVGMLLILRGALKGWRRLKADHRRLRRVGQLIYGEVLTSAGRLRPKEGYKVTIQCAFRLPDTTGRVLNWEQTRIVNWMQDKPLPAKGTPVALLYVDEALAELL